MRAGEAGGCVGGEGNLEELRLGAWLLDWLNFGRRAVCLKSRTEERESVCVRARACGVCVVCQRARALAVTTRGDPEGSGVDEGKDTQGPRCGRG